MKEMDLNDLLPPVVLGYIKKRSRAPVFLTLPGNLPKLYWPDASLAQLIRASINLLAESKQAESPIRLTVSKRLHLEDLENLLEFKPSCWIQFRMEAQLTDDSENGIRELPERFGLRCGGKWQPDSNSCLTFYVFGANPSPAFVFWLQSYRARRRYTLVIPVTFPSDCPKC